MKQVDILCVMATHSNEDVINDQIESLFWGFESNIFLVIINDGLNELNFSQSNIAVIRSKGAIHKASKVGFKINEGLSWAFEKGIKFNFAMIFDDDALIIGKGLDLWAFNKFEKSKNLGLLGTGDDEASNQRYSDIGKIPVYKKLMFDWFNIENLKIPKKFMFYAVNFQSYEMISYFFEKNFLSHEKEIWPFPCETFQTIATFNSIFDIEFHGQYPQNMVPPLYVMHHGSTPPTDPRKLSKDFLIHHSIRRIKGIKEWEIRNFYRNVRKNRVYKFL